MNEFALYEEVILAGNYMVPNIIQFRSLEEAEEIYRKIHFLSSQQPNNPKLLNYVKQAADSLILENARIGKIPEAWEICDQVILLSDTHMKKCGTALDVNYTLSIINQFERLYVDGVEAYFARFSFLWSK